MKTKNLEEKLLLNKIVGYSALAGAALLLTPTAAKGDIVYVDPEDIVVNSGAKTFDIDINNDGVGDFQFKLDTHTLWSSVCSTLSLDNLVASNYVSSTNGYVAKRTNNISVISGNNWKTNKNFVRGFYYTYYPSRWSTERGNWKSESEDKYFGVKFKISGETHYGWIRASIVDPTGGMQITIHDWAYEDDPNTSIQTGETPTPIELSHFTAMEENGAIRLNWETASETENSGYVIQRKIANGTWENLADYHADPELMGYGTTSESHNYSWLDNNVLPGCAYQYRLGDVNYNNKIVWHDVVEITVSEETANIPGEFGLQAAFPNPFNPTLTIRYGLTEDAQTSVKILDLQGKTIANLSDKHQRAGSYELQWQAGDAASGVYLVKVVSGEKSDLRKVLLTK